RMGRLAGVVAVLFAGFGARSADAASPHPLDPLTREELATVGAVLARSTEFSPGTNFAWITLDEPPKALVQELKPGAPFPRKAALTAVDYARRKAYEVTVDIKSSRIESLTELVGVQPGLNPRDVEIARDIVDADPQIKAALVRRGLDISGRVSEAVQVHY